MNKITMFMIFVFLIILMTITVYAPTSNLEKRVENDKMIIECDKEEYKVILGYSYAYCTIINKEQGKLTTDIYSILEKEKGVKISRIYYKNNNIWKSLGTTNYEDIRTFKGQKTSKKVQIDGESKIELKIELDVTSSSVLDEFWLGTDNFELDPVVSGCDDTDPNILVCTGGTFTGNSIDTAKNILINDSTIDGTAGGGIVNLTSDGWIQINNSIINGYGDTQTTVSVNGNFLANAVGNIWINGSTIDAHGVTASVSQPRGGASGYFEVYSSSGNVSIFGSTLTHIGSGGSADSASGSGGGGSYSYINATNIIINRTTITANGGAGSCGETGKSAPGGISNVKWYANQITALTSISKTWNFNQGACGSGCTCGSDGSTVLFNASKIFFDAQNTSVLSLTMTSTGGGSKTEFKVNDELRLDDNVTLTITTNSANNFSKFNFTGNDNLKFLFSGVSIPTSKYFVFCDNKPADQNVSVLWENFGGKTQEIDLQYCSYENTTRASFFGAGFPTYTNLQNNASTTTKYGGVVNWSVTLSDDLNLKSYSFAHNMSGILTNFTSTPISGTSYLASYNLTINLTRDNYICGKFFFNDSLSNTNQTNLSCFSVANSIPTISSLTLNDTSIGSDDINITCIASDADSDTITFNYLWYINGTATTFDTFHLQSGNLTIGANITGSCNATDSIGFSSWQNTSTATVGDTTAPVISGLSISSTSGVIGTVITIGATCTEANILAIGHPKVAIIHSVAGLKENKTMPLVSGSDYSTTYTTAESSGTYNFSFYCDDGSGNEESNLSNSLLFTATTPGTTTTPGGGGGAPPAVTQCETDEDCEDFGDKYVCIQNFCIYQEFESVCNYNGICEAERGENILNCGDVFVNNTLVLSGDCSFTDLPRIALSSQYVLYSIIGLIIIGTITFNQMAKKPEQRFKAFRIPKKFFRRKK